MNHIQIEIPLRGVSKGSTHAFNNIIVDVNKKKIQVAEAMIRMELKRKYPELKINEGPVFVLIHCGFSRPKNHFNSKGEPSKNFKTYYMNTPDADKCTRTVLDALTGAAFKDDRQVCFSSCFKTYAEKDFTRIHCFTEVIGKETIQEVLNHMANEIR